MNASEICRAGLIVVLAATITACSTTSSWTGEGYETLMASADTKKVPAREAPASGGASSDADLNKQSQNPIASLISLPLQNNTNFNVGPGDKTTNVLNVQPVVPFALSEDVNLIVRDITPVIYLPDDLAPGFDSEFGLGDSILTAFLSPSKSEGITWGAGPVLLAPTSTDDALGKGQWGGGVSAVALAMPGKFVLGGLVNNIWSFEGDINSFTFQPFVNYNLPDAWAISMAPTLTCNWKAAGSQQWTVPVGGGISKLFRFGKQPVKFALNGYTYAHAPDNAADWTLQFQITFLFPK